MLKRIVKIGLIVGGMFACEALLADSGGKTIGEVAANVTNSLDQVAKLISGASFVAGVGFALAGMVKFKAHKDQPQQVPLSAAIVLLAVGAGLIFLPSVIKSAGQTLFGGSQTQGGATGQGLNTSGS